MPDPAALLAWANAHPLLSYGIASVLLTALLTERSRVDAWCERNPRLAAVMKTMRAVGLDPWHLVAALSLAVNKRLPPASKRVPSLPTMMLMLVVVPLVLLGCASVKPVLRTVNDAATILCETSFGAQERARAQGINVRELCQLHEVLDPFIDEALAAQKAAAGRAGLPKQE